MSFEKQRKWKSPDESLCRETAVGMTVMSLAGRDKGRIYTVLDTYSDVYGRQFAKLIGINRTECRPKVKNLRQLAKMPYDESSHKPTKRNREG